MSALRTRALPILVLLALVAVAHGRTVTHPFLYDDVILVLQNPEIRSFDSLPKAMGFGKERFDPENRWTRLVTYTLEYAAVGPWPPLYHFDNVVLHAAVAWLVFGLVSRIFVSRRVGFWAAALFAVHPLTTDVVAQVAGRRELLAALFGFATLLFLERARRPGGRAYFVAALVALVLGGYSKEWVVVVPGLFVAIELQQRREQGDGAGSFAGLRGLAMWVRDAFRLLAERPVFYGLLATVVLLLCLELINYGFATRAGGSAPIEGQANLGGSLSYYDAMGQPLDLLDRLRLVGMGLRLAIVPLGLSVDYFYDGLELVSPGWSGMALLDLAILVVGVVFTLWGLSRRNVVGFGGFWFFLLYLPHSGIFQWHEIFAERWLYGSLVGVCVVVAALLAAGLERAESRRYTAVAACGLVAVLLLGSVQRNGDWRSDEALWSAAAARYPNSARSHKGLANAYRQQGKLELALEQYRAAVEILPEYRDVHFGVVTTLTALGRAEEAERELDELLGRWPKDARALYLRGQLFDNAGRPRLALAYHTRAIEADPSYAPAYNDLGRLYAQTGRFGDALAALETAIQLDPSMRAALQNLVILYETAARNDAKAAEYRARLEALEAGGH